MAIQGLTDRDVISRQRLRRDTRTTGEKALEFLRSIVGIGCVYMTLIAWVVMCPWAFDLCLVLGLGFAIVPLTQKSTAPFRIRKSLGLTDPNDTIPGTRKARKGRGIFLLGNRAEDGAEIWGGNEDMRTHGFVLGSTGAGKTEGLISLFWNTLVMCSGAVYLDGKADVKLWAQFWSMCRALGREDDLLALNYMTGNADTTQRRATKLSNTTNQMASGNAESNTQLLVDLMDAAGSGGDMWKGRAISWLSSLMPPLHELRDKGYINLHVGLIRDSAPPLKYFELMEHPALSERSRDGMKAFLSTVPGYNPAKKPEQQSSSFLDQYGFQTMQFTRILGSLADTYGHIYSTPAGEVVFKDVVLNRRILLVLLPALEKSRPELANLGKINVAALKSMMGTELGGELEGDKRDLLDARSTNAPMPFLAIFDEFGYFMPDGAALMWAQARGLGFSLIAAGQDLQAFFRTSREETMAIVSNCNIKIIGKLEDPDATYDMVRKIAGEAYTAEHEGYDTNLEGIGGFKTRLGVRVSRTDRVTLQDLKDQVEGDIHIFVKSNIIRGRTFYAAPKLAKTYRLNHFIKVLPPSADVIRARRLDVRHLITSLHTEPFAALDAPADRLAALASLQAEPRCQQYMMAKNGQGRGIFLFERLAASDAPSGDEGQGAGTVGGLAHKPVAEPAVRGLASAPAATAPATDSTDATIAGLADMMGVSTAPAEPSVAPTTTVVETFDGANLTVAPADLQSTNVFGTTAKQSLAESMASIAAAAQPMLEGLFDLSKAETATSRERDRAGGQGDLDRGETSVRLNRIALGLGAEPEEANAAVDALLTAATEGTEYPQPPKPAATPDKLETMENVMDDLQALIAGAGSGQP